MNTKGPLTWENIDDSLTLLIDSNNLSTPKGLWGNIGGSLTSLVDKNN